MKIYSDFTTGNHNTFRGNFSKIAERYSVSDSYVGLISRGKRELKSKKSIEVFIALLEILKMLSPENYNAYLLNTSDEVLKLIKNKSESTYKDYLTALQNID